MAVIGWGKPNIFYKALSGSDTAWHKLDTPAEDSTNLSTTKGDKTEAKVEGGANEDVKYKKNTYALSFTLRAAKDRKRPFTDVDGVIVTNYAIVLQPEDEMVQGFAIEKATVSVEDSFSTAEGGMWAYTFDALQPAAGQQVKWGIIKVTSSGETITKIEIKGDNDSTYQEVAKAQA